VLGTSCDWLARRLKKAVHAGAEEHRRAGRPVAAQPGRARAAAVRHAGALPARPARAAGRVQGEQRAGGLRRAGRGGRRRRCGRGRSAARRVAARTHRHGREPDLRAEHHRPGRPDEGQRPAAAGADARIPAPGDLMAVFTRPAPKSDLQTRATSPSSPKTCMLTDAAAERHAAQGAWRQRAAVRPARHRQDRAGQGLRSRRRPVAVRSGIRRPRRQQPVRPRPLPQPADQPGLPQGQPRRGAAVRRGRRRLSPISTEAAQMMARLDSSRCRRRQRAASAARPG
jgi:hypothetical protein